MRDFNRNRLASVCFMAAAALIGAVGLARALTSPATYAPRMFQTQQVHYERFSFAFNSCVLVSNACSLKMGALPYNAWLTTFRQQIITSFNSGTTDTIGFGLASGGVTVVAAQSVHGAAGDATALSLVHAGITLTGNGVTPTGLDGGFDLFATYAQTGSAPSAGLAVFELEYVAPNDGACTNAPLGSVPTPSAC